MDFTTAAQLLALCQEGSVTLGEAMLRREMDLTGASREEYALWSSQLDKPRGLKVTHEAKEFQGSSPPGV